MLVPVVPGALVVAHSDLDDLVQGPVRLSVTAAGQAVALGLAGGHGDWAGPAECCEGCWAAQPLGIVTGGDHQDRGQGRADAVDGAQPGVPRGGVGVELLVEVVDLATEVLVPPRQTAQGPQDGGVGEVTDLVRAGGGQQVDELVTADVAVFVTQAGIRVD